MKKITLELIVNENCNTDLLIDEIRKATKHMLDIKEIKSV